MHEFSQNKGVVGGLSYINSKRTWKILHSHENKETVTDVLFGLKILWVSRPNKVSNVPPEHFLIG